MNIIEEAQHYAALIEQKVTKDQIARDHGIGRTMIEHRLAWLDLPPEVQRLAAEGKLPSNIRVAKALAKLPKGYQVSLAWRFSHSGARIDTIEQVVDAVLNRLLMEQVTGDEPLEDGRPFLAVRLAEEGVGKQERRRRLNAEARQSARTVCEYCTLYPNLVSCKACALVTMLTVLIRRD